ncbi:MAG TPA: RraA family protein [Candidatus Mediterraneibacter stercoripullorum]|nr:RraA family protein [Candidatus Mediterraneibacter stercoripullorum]
MIINTKEQIVELTKEWKGERFADGRPRVPDSYLEKLRTMTLEEIWLPLYVKGYHFQYEGRMKCLHGGKKLVGRAVTCTFMPTRPDLSNVVKKQGEEKGWQGFFNQWVVDHLETGDVVVADMFDKILNGTFVGGNLTTAIHVKTETGGAVIWGGVRDVEQMKKIDTQVFYRGINPTPIRECVITDLNGACHIGEAVCLPGDVVMGTESGVLFIPSHLTEELINCAEKTHAKDIFGFAMLEQGVYTTAEIDNSVWSIDMMDRLVDFIETDPRCEKYRGLDWSLEIGAAHGDPDCLEEVLKTCLT